MSRDYMTHRIETPKPQRAERIVYTDAAGETKIVAAACLTPETFASYDRLISVRASKTGHRWRKNFKKTCHIYGLEVLAVLAILLGKADEPRNRSVNFYIDSNNSLCALRKTRPTHRESRQWWGLFCIASATFVARLGSRESRTNETYPTCPRACRGSPTTPHVQGHLGTFAAYARSSLRRPMRRNKDTRPNAQK